MRLNPVIRLITLLAVIAGGVFAIRMSPAAFTAQNIPIGTEFDLGVPLVIRLSENDTVAKYFTATPLKPGEVRNDWLDGYEEIPDAGYLKIEGDGAVYVEPDKPVTTIILFFGIVRSTSLRLCSLAPLIKIVFLAIFYSIFSLSGFGFSFCLMIAFTNDSNSGCGSRGLLRNSGWNCTPIING